MIIDKKIQELGLTDKEAKVYVALLELGQATAQQLSIKSGINRATTYVMLDTLQSRGVVSTIEKEKKTFFMIEDPFALIKSLEEEQKDLEERMGKAKKVIPELQLIYNLSRDRSHVRLFEGKESIRIIQNEIARSKSKSFHSITNISLAHETWPQNDKDHRQPIYKKGFKEHLIICYDQNKPVPDVTPFGKGKGTERRYLPQNKFPIEAEITLYDTNKVAIVTLRDNIVGVTIENDEIFSTMKVLFDSLWETAKGYKISFKK